MRKGVCGVRCRASASRLSACDLNQPGDGSPGEPNLASGGPAQRAWSRLGAAPAARPGRTRCCSSPVGWALLPTGRHQRERWARLQGCLSTCGGDGFGFCLVDREISGEKLASRHPGVSGRHNPLMMQTSLSFPRNFRILIRPPFPPAIRCFGRCDLSRLAALRCARRWGGPEQFRSLVCTLRFVSLRPTSLLSPPLREAPHLF